MKSALLRLNKTLFTAMQLIKLYALIKLLWRKYNDTRRSDISNRNSDSDTKARNEKSHKLRRSN